MPIVRHRSPALDQLHDLRLFMAARTSSCSGWTAWYAPKTSQPERCSAARGTLGGQTFVIVSGQAAVTIDGVPIATLGPGSFFGEMSVLDRCRRAATVTALTPMTLLVLTSQELELLLADVPQVARQMLATMGSRLRHADRAFGERAQLVGTS